MNCHEAERQIFAERDGGLGLEEIAALADHVAQCPACRRMRTDLAVAIDDWRSKSAAATVPNAELEWQKLRRLKRNDTGPAGVHAARRGRNLLTWLAVPIAAAAMVTIAFFVIPPLPRPTAPTAAIAESGATGAADDASTVVFVDEKSGWLVVWASAAHPKQI